MRVRIGRVAVFVAVVVTALSCLFIMQRKSAGELCVENRRCCDLSVPTRERMAPGRLLRSGGHSLLTIQQHERICPPFVYDAA
jgi:hypothetical protein